MYTLGVSQKSNGITRPQATACASKLFKLFQESILGMKITVNDIKAVASQTAIVTGGSRGLGRGIAEALAAKKMRVFALARDSQRLASLAKESGVETVVADMTDSMISGRLLQDLNPDLLVLCGGALPLMRPVHLHTWETFSTNWATDTKATFNWVRDALLLPMRPRAHVIVISSMAAVVGSSLSGGYAGAKRMQWWIAEYAALEAARLKLNLRFHCLLPTLTASTALGRMAMAAYAQRAGVTPEDYAKRFDPPMTPAIVGQAVVDLHENPSRWEKLTYQVSGEGLRPID
jgi:NAD(P)-dependent dehydrogenase (short-subunit alcohol dehydrogenase family)